MRDACVDLGEKVLFRDEWKRFDGWKRFFEE